MLYVPCDHKNYSYKGHLICAVCGLTKRDFDLFAFNEGDENRVHVTSKKSEKDIITELCFNAMLTLRKLIDSLEGVGGDIPLFDILDVFETYILTSEDRGRRRFRISARPDLTNKKYVDDEITKVKSHGSTNTLQKSGGTMKGDINMGGYEVIGVTSVPSFNNSLVNKKYVDDEVLAVSGGINQTQADARYVRKTKTTIGGEWMDVFSDMSFADYNWSRYVKKDTLNSDSNIETRVASFVTDMSLSQLLKHKLVLGVRYVSSSSAVVKQLETITLSGKSYKKLSYGPSGNYKYMYSFHIHDEYYIGNDADAKNSFLWQLGAKFETSSVHYLLNTTAYVSFALNEAGQYG